MTAPPSERHDAPAKKSSPLLGILPFIGVILFVIHAITILAGGKTGDWEKDLFDSAVFNMVGVAGIGAGISHLFFSKPIAASIGWQSNQFQKEIGFTNLALGITGVLAPSYDVDFALAAIIASSIFRAGAGLVHIRDIVEKRNFAINNTGILFLNFVVPAFLFWAYGAWAGSGSV